MKQIVCIYDQGTGDFLRIQKQLLYVILRGDNTECFFSHEYNDKKSKVLYSAAKDRIPNIMISTCFKKLFHEILNKRRHNEEFSGVFFFLPSITNWKKKINQHRDNVNLSPIDCSLYYLNLFSPDKEVSFRPDLLNSANAELRSPKVELHYRFFRHVANLIEFNP